MSRIASCFSLLVIINAQVALGCLNDSELPDREREFRSQYLDSEVDLMTKSEPDQMISNPGFTKSIVGVSLIIGAVGFTFFSRK